MHPYHVAEFFAGIGLVRLGLERAGFRVRFANDIEVTKQALYVANFGNADFVLDDVRNITGSDIPVSSLATASFPCTDLSLAGNRAGLAGQESSMFWEFARVLNEMGSDRPTAVLLENVPSFATSNSGRDLTAAIEVLNRLGYSCDPIIVDARWFVPQSRPRLIIVGALDPLNSGEHRLAEDDLRPPWLVRFIQKNVQLQFHNRPMQRPIQPVLDLSDVIERLPWNARCWWSDDRASRFVDSLSEVQSDRLSTLRAAPKLNWATAYRRTRNGRAVWEIRGDGLSGCLRTARGGSSKQALVEAGRGRVRIRWMTAREYARLQGAPDFQLRGVSNNQALFGMGDAVCAPVIEWIARSYIRPLLDGSLSDQTKGLTAVA